MSRPTDASTWRWFDVATLANFVSIGILLVAVPRFAREELGASAAAAGAATTVFFAGALVTRPIVGRAMDRLGRRRFLLWPLAAMAVIALGFDALTTVWAAILLRLLQGVFGSTFYTACAVVATDLSPPERRASALARLSLTIYLGLAVGPSIGEWLLDRSGTAPWVVAACGHLVALAAASRLPETTTEESRAAPVGSTAGLRRVVARPGIAQLCSGLGYACVIAFLPEYSRSIGLGSSGALFFAFAMSVLGVRLVSGRVADRVGYTAVAVPGLAVLVVGHSLLGLAWSTWVPFVAMVLLGIGTGSVFPALASIAASRAPDTARGAALGIFLSFSDLGNAAAGPLVGAVVDATSIRWAFGTAALVAAVGMLLAMGLGPMRPAGERAATSGSGSSAPRW